MKKKLIAIVIAVTLLASVSGVALAKDFDNYKEVGHGALNGPHYNLNIIGVEDTKTADMTGTSGHTIFVKLKGRTKINLLNSSDPLNDEYCGGKDFRVWDRNGTDGEATFCLPKPLETGGPCDEGAGYTEYHYTVFARALGGPGKSFTTTCMEDKLDPSIVYCSSITMLLERDNGRSKFTDVSKYLLFIYVDLDADGVPERYPIFDDAGYGYWWDYVNDNLRLAQLRFYMTPTCVPDVADTYIDSGPTCIEEDGPTNVGLIGVGTYFETNLKIYVVDVDGMDTINVSNVDVSSDTSLTMNLTTTDDTALGTATIFITSGNGAGKETVRWDFEVSETCNGNG